MLTSCDDFLEKNPRDTFTNTPAFWSNDNLVESYANRFYAYYGGATNFYFNVLNGSDLYLAVVVGVGYNGGGGGFALGGAGGLVGGAGAQRQRKDQRKTHCYKLL